MLRNSANFLVLWSCATLILFGYVPAAKSQCKSNFCKLDIAVKSKTQNAQDANIHYIYFSMDTYTPVTPDNIDKRSFNITSATDKDFVILYDLIRQRRGIAVFDKSNVRLSIKNPSKGTILVDQDGIVQVGSISYSLKRLAFVRLSQLMLKLVAKQRSINHPDEKPGTVLNPYKL